MNLALSMESTRDSLTEKDLSRHKLILSSEFLMTSWQERERRKCQGKARQFVQKEIIKFSNQRERSLDLK